MSEPGPRYFSARLAKHGPLVGVKLVFDGPILDGEIMDRSPRYQVVIDTERDGRLVWQLAETGVPFEVDGSTLRDCKPIDETEYRYLIGHATWAQDNHTQHPRATPRKTIDLRTLPSLF